MPNLYSIDLKVCATAYIKANSSGEAMAKARKLARCSLSIGNSAGDVPISECDLRDPALPEISASPAMTIHGVWSEFEEKEASMDLAQMDLPELAKA